MSGKGKADNENWLLDLFLSYYKFHTEASCLYLKVLDLSQEFKSLVQANEEFFGNEKRIKELKNCCILFLPKHLKTDRVSLRHLKNLD